MTPKEALESISGLRHIVKPEITLGMLPGVTAESEANILQEAATILSKTGTLLLVILIWYLVPRKDPLSSKKKTKHTILGTKLPYGRTELGTTQRSMDMVSPKNPIRERTSRSGGVEWKGHNKQSI